MWTPERHKKDVDAIDLQLPFDADVVTAVRKANVRLLHDNRMTQVRFLMASHVMSGNPSPNKIVRDTYDWHVKFSLILRCTLNHFNTISNAAISHATKLLLHS